jgi:hypothetical protein
MTDLIVVPQAAHWQRLKRLVLDSVSSPITRRVYNLGLDEFFEWYGREPRPGFTKATVCAWRVSLEALGLGPASINVRITAVRKLAVEAADNGLLAPELAGGIVRVKGVASKGIRLGNWLSLRQAQTLLNAPGAPPRACATARSWRCSWAAASGGPKWRRSQWATSSSAMAGGASWISLESMAACGRSPCRRG